VAPPRRGCVWPSANAPVAYAVDTDCFDYHITSLLPRSFALGTFPQQFRSALR